MLKWKLEVNSRKESTDEDARKSIQGQREFHQQKFTRIGKWKADYALK